MVVADAVKEVAPPCRYLFHEWHDYRPQHRTPSHQHHFWHVDYIQCGKGSCAEGTDVWRFDSETAIIMPPARRHLFTYDESTKLLSVKFLASIATAHPAALLGSRSDVFPALRAIERLAQGENPAEAPALGHLLAAVLYGAYGDGIALQAVGADLESTLLWRIQPIVASSAGRAVTVGDVARRLGKSPAHLSEQFRKETGLSLKHWLDVERCKVAARLLLNTDATISEIAAQCGYSDGSALSRFFTRVMRESPSRYRDTRR